MAAQGPIGGWACWEDCCPWGDLLGLVGGVDNGGGWLTRYGPATLGAPRFMAAQGPWLAGIVGLVGRTGDVSLWTIINYSIT